MDYGVERQTFWYHFGQSVCFQSHVPVSRNVRVEAGWLFSGSNQDSDASSERSENANDDILMFFFQLDLGTRVQVFTCLLQFLVNGGHHMNMPATNGKSHVYVSFCSMLWIWSSTKLQNNWEISLLRLAISLLLVHMKASATYITVDIEPEINFLFSCQFCSFQILCSELHILINCSFGRLKRRLLDSKKQEGGQVQKAKFKIWL